MTRPIALAVLFAAQVSFAATPQSLTYDEFIAAVIDGNLGYAAQRYNVDIARAQLAAATLLPNPSLQLYGNRDLTYHDAHGIGTDGERVLLRQVESRSGGLTQTLELGGKRTWRIRVADQTLQATAANLDDFLRNLKADASEAFVLALATKATVEQQRVAAGYLADLSRAQEIRYRAGGISEVDLTQTRLEEFEFRDELVKAEDAAARAQLALATFLGPQNDRLVGAEGRLEQPPASYDLTNLISRALEQRPDLLALRHAEEAASNSVDLARSKIVPDVDLGVTYGYNGPVAVDHPVDPTPSFHQLGVTVTMTLPLYDRGQHDVAIARSQVEQAKAQFAAAQTTVEIEVRTADSQYRSALQRAAAFRSDVLASATAVLDAKRYSYQRGGSTLLELLSAQRAANDVQQAYQDALAEVATALIELQRATGATDLKF